jgi:flagellin-like protein
MGRNRRSMMKDRRGISPLIATILLIAFAVALGSVVYTYFIILVDNAGASGQGCERFISLSSTPDRSGDYVYDFDRSTGIRVVVYNNGPNEVTALTYVVEGTKQMFKVEEGMNRIAPGTSDWISIPYDTEVYGEIMRIVITPHYKHSGHNRICTEGRLEIIKRRTS